MLNALPKLRRAFDQEPCVFALPSEPGWYLYLGKLPCTRFYITWFAAPTRFQREVIRDLREKEPRTILYSSPNWTNAIDGIPAQRRYPELVDFIKNRYVPAENLDGYQLYRLK